jgi:hypothetical protein
MIEQDWRLLMQNVRLTDHVIWFKYIEDDTLLERLRKLRAEEEINLEIGGIVGRWIRVGNSRDGRPTDAIKPSGPMHRIWNEWYVSRRGDRLSVREAPLTGMTPTTNNLFPEWQTAEDEVAFGDL